MTYSVYVAIYCSVVRVIAAGIQNLPDTMAQMLDEGENWDASQWQKINVGGGIEDVMVPKGTPVWAGYEGEEWRHPGIGQRRDWQQRTFDTAIEKCTKIIAEAKAKKRQLKEAKQALIDKESKEANAIEDREKPQKKRQKEAREEGQEATERSQRSK